MASSTPSSSNVYMSGDFTLAAGSVLFRISPITDKLEICILFHRKSSKWVLPKGRKDCGETMETAAARETFEETGYPCEPLPCRMPTRAPIPGVNTHPAIVSVVDNITEPFAVTIRDLSNKRKKLIWWYLMRVTSNSVEKVLGTQMASEDFDSHFVDAQEAVNMLSLKEYRDVVARALELVQGSLSDIQHSSQMFNP